MPMKALVLIEIAIVSLIVDVVFWGVSRHASDFTVAAA